MLSSSWGCHMSAALHPLFFAPREATPDNMTLRRQDIVSPSPKEKDNVSSTSIWYQKAPDDFIDAFLFVIAFFGRMTSAKDILTTAALFLASRMMKHFFSFFLCGVKVESSGWLFILLFSNWTSSWLWMIWHLLKSLLSSLPSHSVGNRGYVFTKTSPMQDFLCRKAAIALLLPAGMALLWGSFFSDKTIGLFFGHLWWREVHRSGSVPNSKIVDNGFQASGAINIWSPFAWAAVFQCPTKIWRWLKLTSVLSRLIFKSVQNPIALFINWNWAMYYFCPSHNIKPLLLHEL